MKLKNNVLRFGYKQVGTNDYCFDILKSILDNRNLGYINEQDFFEPTYQHLIATKILNNLDKACERVLTALASDESIHFLADEDADGYTSNSSLVEYAMELKVLLKSKSKITWSVHDKKTHGIKIEELDRYKFDILIMADGGTSDYDEHKHYNEKGIDIIILDHHMPSNIEHTYSERTIVVNNQICDYPNKELSGAGIVYKFIQNMETILNRDIEQTLCKYSTLLSIGIIADMMDIKNTETRFIVKQGLQSVEHPIVKELLLLKKIQKPKITDISFYVAPYFNAMCRTGTPQEKAKFFESLFNPMKSIIKSDVFDKKKSNGFESKYLYQEVIKDLLRIKETQEKMQIELVESLQPQLNVADKINVCVIEGSSLIKGMVANMISTETMKPTIVVEEKPEGLYGSARGFFATSDDFKSDVRKSELFDLSEGHPNAFGIGFKEDNLKSIKEYFNQLYKETNFLYPIDFSIKSKDLSLNICERVESYKYEFCKGFEEPLILLQNFEIDNVWVNNPKKTVLKITNKEYEVVLFLPTDEDIEYLQKGTVVNLLGRIGINEFMGKRTGQFIVDKYEIIGKAEREETKTKDNNDWW